MSDEMKQDEGTGQAEVEKTKQAEAAGEAEVDVSDRTEEMSPAEIQAARLAAEQAEAPEQADGDDHEPMEDTAVFAADGAGEVADADGGPDGDERDDGVVEADPPPERNSEDMSILEAALFASSEILSAQRLKLIVPGEPDARAVRRMVNTLNTKLQRERHPFEIVELGGGYQFRTVPYYHPWIQRVFKEKAARRLSIQALECLAIIAYRQPITRAEIEQIRGVTSEGAMKTLLEKHLVTVAGRSEKAGRPLLYATAPVFLQYFGLNKIADLPRIEEFEAMARQKMDDLTDEELRRIEEIAGEQGGADQDHEDGASDDQAPHGEDE